MSSSLIKCLNNIIVTKYNFFLYFPFSYLFACLFVCFSGGRGSWRQKYPGTMKVIMWTWLLHFQIRQMWTLFYLCTPVLWGNVFSYDSSQSESGVQLLTAENELTASMRKSILEALALVMCYVCIPHSRVVGSECFLGEAVQRDSQPFCPWASWVFQPLLLGSASELLPITP